MKGKRRSAAQLARDRRVIAAAYLKGELQVDIAERLNVSQTTVSTDLKALIEEWRESALVDIDEAKAQELARINLLEVEAWEAWERSKEDAETTVQKEKRSGGSTASDATRELQQTSKGQVGDPRFLDTVKWCIDRRCKIFGVDAPEKRELSGPQGSRLFDDNKIRIFVHSEDG